MRATPKARATIRVRTGIPDPEGPTAGPNRPESRCRAASYPASGAPMTLGKGGNLGPGGHVRRRKPDLTIRYEMTIIISSRKCPISDFWVLRVMLSIRI